MASIEAAMYGRDLRQLFDGLGVVGLTEAQLVDRIARRDESAELAFEAILRRHGPPTPRDRVRRGDLAAAPGLSGFHGRVEPKLDAKRTEQAVESAHQAGKLSSADGTDISGPKSSDDPADSCGVGHEFRHESQCKVRNERREKAGRRGPPLRRRRRFGVARILPARRAARRDFSDRKREEQRSTDVWPQRSAQ
jgi:hypothetical protein